jgi:Rhodanese-related sulfurtransferase
MNSITARELQEWLRLGKPVQLIDVREPHEHEAFNLGGTLMPLSTVTNNLQQIETAMPVVFYCRVGMRSQIAIQRLQDKFPFKNLINLTGGTEAWRKHLQLDRSAF